VSNVDLDAAARAARYLATLASTIRALPTTGASARTIERLATELSQNYSDARAAIRAVANELKLTRNCAVQLGDIVAATAHEATLEMVYALNRERFGVEIIGRKAVEAWPDVRVVLAEIEVETSKARDRRALARAASTPAGGSDGQPAKRTGRPRKGESDKERLVLGALVRQGRRRPGRILLGVSQLRQAEAAHAAVERTARGTTTSVSCAASGATSSICYASCAA
jgi:hypothetical protein